MVTRPDSFTIGSNPAHRLTLKDVGQHPSGEDSKSQHGGRQQGSRGKMPRPDAIASSYLTGKPQVRSDCQMPTDCDDRGGCRAGPASATSAPIFVTRRSRKSTISTSDSRPRPRAAKSHLLSVSHDRAPLSYHAVRINADQPRPDPAALSASISGDPMRRLLTATRMRTVRLDVRNDGTF